MSARVVFREPSDEATAWALAVRVAGLAAVVCAVVGLALQRFMGVGATPLLSCPASPPSPSASASPRLRPPSSARSIPSTPSWRSSSTTTADGRRVTPGRMTSRPACDHAGHARPATRRPGPWRMARGLVLGRGAGRARRPGRTHARRRPTRPRCVDPPLHRPRRRRGPRGRRRRAGRAPGGAGWALLRRRRDRRGRRGRSVRALVFVAAFCLDMGERWRARPTSYPPAPSARRPYATKGC